MQGTATENIEVRVAKDEGLPELATGERLISAEIVGRAPGMIMHNIKSMAVEVGGSRPKECIHGISMDKPCAVGLESMTYRTDLGEGGGSGIAGESTPLPEGVAYCIPSNTLYSCLLRAASASAIKVGRRTTPLSYVLPGALRIEPANIVLYDPKTGKPIRNFDIRADHVVVNRARVLRFRPYIREWSAKFYLAIAPTGSFSIDPALIKQALSDAGLRVGLFDWRPVKKGPYGTFTVKGFEEIEGV